MGKAENTAEDLARSEDAVSVRVTITTLPTSLPIMNKKFKKGGGGQGILPGSHERLTCPDTGQIQRLGPGY